MTGILRLCVIVEGQTEQSFVDQLLKPFLEKMLGHDNSLVHTALVGKCGGCVKYERAKKDIRNTLRSGQYVTTMLDYYGLPADYPKRQQNTIGDPVKHATLIEDAILEDVAHELGTSFNRRRFIPYLSVHEFEALIFSDPVHMAKAFDCADLATPLAAIRDAFPSPEHIDDSPQTAPCKRIENLLPAYGKNKVRYGPLAAGAVGLEAMRRECAHFREWLEKLEALA